MDHNTITRLSWETFPDQPPQGQKRIPVTIANTKHVLDHHGILMRYNIIKKRLEISVDGQNGIADDAAYAQIINVFNLYGLSTNHVMTFVHTLSLANSYNPVKEWIDGKKWDGVDHFSKLCDTVTATKEYPQELKRVLLLRWLISVAAAALMQHGFKARGVLCFQGAQGVGKSSWVRRLIPHPMTDEWVKLDHIMNARDKDSVMTAVSHLVVEFGELESSFRHDPGRLKGFITADTDKLRRPYARTDSTYPRRTVFCATVNDGSFLIDKTGNSRFWTIDVDHIDYEHEIDMQQLWAQMADKFRSGERWWLNKDEEDLLAQVNKEHMVVSHIEDLLSVELDLDRLDDPNLKHLSASEVLKRIGIDHPTATQTKECAAYLREHIGRCTRIKGKNGWRVAFITQHGFKRGGGPLIDENGDF